MASFFSSFKIKRRRKGKRDPLASSSPPVSQSPTRASIPAPKHISSADGSSKVDLARDVASDQLGSTSAYHSVAKSTAINLLKLTLATLGQASDNLPVPGLQLAIGGLLSAIEKVQVCLWISSYGILWTNDSISQVTAGNAQGFRELSKRLDDLQPIFLQMQRLDKGNTSVVKYLNQLET
jgi:hypothetical protein